MEDPTKKHLVENVKKIQQEMDVLFDHFYKIKHSYSGSGPGVWHPPIDCFETGSEVVVLMEIAGLKQEDFSIAVKDDVLTIHGNRNEKADPQRIAFHHMEINYGRFERNLKLPQGMDTKSVKATYKDGVLEIRIKKTPGQGKKAQEIKIE